MQRKIIDFHIHPFIQEQDNFCRYKNVSDLETAKRRLMDVGVEKVCGSVIRTIPQASWSDMQALNDEALKIRDLFPDFYVAGFHVHPKFVKESVKEIERMVCAGVTFVGELVPYFYEWGYADGGFAEILETINEYSLPVSLHTMPNEFAAVEKLVEKYPKINFIAAHPGEYPIYSQHIELLKKYDNYYLDLSGSGIFRFGMLRYGIDQAGAKKFLYGTDFPICNPFTYIGGVENDYTLSEEEKQAIFYGNAKRLLGL